MNVVPHTADHGEQRSAVPSQNISFGRFRLLPREAVLLDERGPVRLGSRAMDLLIVLAGRPGELVGKADLMARLWPDTFVEETNLRVHVAALRRALGDGRDGQRYLANVPGRGYRFVAPVEPVAGASPPPVAGRRAGEALPPFSRVIGRDEEVARLAAQVSDRRFVSLVGPGGIGKTTVALAVARRLAPACRTCFVDLGGLAGPAEVAPALAAALGIDRDAGELMPAILAFAEARQVLIVLDGCEHVVEAAATLAEAVMRSGAPIWLLATSREPLRAEGEHVHRLPPLASPPPSPRLAAAEAATFPAVQLFVDRASTRLGGFELSDGDAPVVAEICRRLDGIALAIELAAGRIDAFGVRGLAMLLDDRFDLLTGGRRMALPRHQTLRATLDWSYGLLSTTERAVLRRLAVITGSMSLEVATRVAAGEDRSAAEVIEALTNLVAKSLVAADMSGPEVAYRLLDTTRAYALSKLAEAGELEDCWRDHAGDSRAPACDGAAAYGALTPAG